MSSSVEARPLEGIRVLDFSWVWSGPMVAATLAELGAQVIKVEHSQRLDSSRLRGRPKRDGRPVDGPSIEIGPYFHQTNHDKLSITVNLKHPQARPILDRLVLESDALVENLSPGALERVSLGYERLAAINPRLVYLSMSAAGQHGPLSAMKAYAPIMSSYCGLESLVGYPGEGAIGMMNFGYGDPNAAVHGLLPLLAALHDAQAHGYGRHIDMSQIEAMLAVLAEPLIDCFMNHRDASPSGNRHPSMAPHGIYPTAGHDQWISIAVANDTQWHTLVELMGQPRWSKRAEFSCLSGRKLAQEDIDKHMADWSRHLDGDELAARLHAADIAASVVHDVVAQWGDPQFAARCLRERVEHPISGEELLYRTPWAMERGAPKVTASAPLLGQHNDFVFGHILGLEPAELARLKVEGVLE